MIQRKPFTHSLTRNAVLKISIDYKDNILDVKNVLKKESRDYRASEKERGSKSKIIIIECLILQRVYTTLSHPSHFCIYMQFRADNATRYCSHDFPIARGRGSECAEKGGGDVCIVGSVCVCGRGRGEGEERWQREEGIHNNTHAHAYTESRTMYVL